MKWTMILIIAAVVVVILVLKHTGQIPAKDVKEHLKHGALVIDVRSPGEFNTGHLPSAINFPLEGIETALPLRVRDKTRVLLLHCQSGIRSAIAVRKLKGIGYTNARDLGSLSRARAIIGEAGVE